MSTLCAYALRNGHRPEALGNPVTGTLPPKDPRGRRGAARVGYSEADMRAIFASPLYTGARGAKARAEPGGFLAFDACHWLPLLGHLTGARLEELARHCHANGAGTGRTA